jgi:hypothetical protein
MRARPSTRIQRGMGGALFIILILLTAAAIVLGRGFVKSEASLDQRAATQQSLGRIADAMLAYVSQNKRLPCPAAGTATTGDADPAVAAATCNSPAGIVPWLTLGLRQADAMDGWGRLISYRAFDGATGFTRTDGIKMTDCNTSATATGTAVATCDPNHYTHPLDFLAGKGLSVNDLGALKSGIAYVLISHGETGKGAYGAETAMRNDLPVAGSKELLNTQSAPPYWILARSDESIPVSDVNHFDDTVTYVAAADLAAAAKLGGRDWGAPSSGSQAFTHAAVQAATGSPFNFNTNATSVTFTSGTAFTSDDFTVTTLAANRRVAAGTDGSGNEGLGSIRDINDTNGAATISTTAGEGLRFSLVTRARTLGITLVAFGFLSPPPQDPQRAVLKFYSSGIQVGSTLTKSACLSSGVANFTVSPGVDFDEFTIEATTTVPSGFGSSFLVGGIGACAAAAASCAAPNAIVPANDCP